MTTPELTGEQIVERERIEKQYGDTQSAEQYYGHLAALLQATKERIKEGYTPQIPEDEGYFENLRDKIMARMQELGIPSDLAGYDEPDEEDPFRRDLRE